MKAREGRFDFDAFFLAHYERIARGIARITGDPARAEELAVEAFWKLWRTPKAHGESAGGWVYRTAVRLGLNDLRRNQRRSLTESQSETLTSPLTPEEAHLAEEERKSVRAVLASIDERQAELLLLRSSGMSYNEVAAALDLNPASVGTLIVRAQEAFRKEYLRNYGKQSDRT